LPKQDPDREAGLERLKAFENFFFRETSFSEEDTESKFRNLASDYFKKLRDWIYSHTFKTQYAQTDEMAQKIQPALKAHLAVLLKGDQMPAPFTLESLRALLNDIPNIYDVSILTELSNLYLLLGNTIETDLEFSSLRQFLVDQKTLCKEIESFPENEKNQRYQKAGINLSADDQLPR
jgi:hypothetical protein